MTSRVNVACDSDSRQIITLTAYAKFAFDFCGAAAKYSEGIRAIKMHLSSDLLSTIKSTCVFLDGTNPLKPTLLSQDSIRSLVHGIVIPTFRIIIGCAKYSKYYRQSFISPKNDAVYFAVTILNYCMILLHYGNVHDELRMTILESIPQLKKAISVLSAGTSLRKRLTNAGRRINLELICSSQNTHIVKFANAICTSLIYRNKWLSENINDRVTLPNNAALVTQGSTGGIVKPTGGNGSLSRGPSSAEMRASNKRDSPAGVGTQKPALSKAGDTGTSSMSLRDSTVAPSLTSPLKTTRSNLRSSINVLTTQVRSTIVQSMNALLAPANTPKSPDIKAKLVVREIMEGERPSDIPEIAVEEAEAIVELVNREVTISMDTSMLGEDKFIDGDHRPDGHVILWLEAIDFKEGSQSREKLKGIFDSILRSYYSIHSSRQFFVVLGVETPGESAEEVEVEDAERVTSKELSLDTSPSPNLVIGNTTSSTGHRGTGFGKRLDSTLGPLVAQQKVVEGMEEIWLDSLMEAKRIHALRFLKRGNQKSGSGGSSRRTKNGKKEDNNVKTSTNVELVVVSLKEHFRGRAAESVDVYFNRTVGLKDLSNFINEDGLTGFTNKLNRKEILQDDALALCQGLSKCIHHCYDTRRRLTTEEMMKSTFFM
jgi:hypothetical protein